MTALPCYRNVYLELMKSLLQRFHEMLDMLSEEFYVNELVGILEWPGWSRVGDQAAFVIALKKTKIR